MKRWSIVRGINWLIVNAVASCSLNAAAQGLTIISADPLPNYALTVDRNDLEQLTDGETSSYPIWVNRASVGWAQRTPVVLRGKLRLHDDRQSAVILRLLVAKGVYAAVYPPRRVDVYCRRGSGGWSHAGVNESSTEVLPDRSVSWVEIELVRSCSEDVALVIHAMGAFLMIDEISYRYSPDHAGLDTDNERADLSTTELVVDSTERLQVQLTKRQNSRDETAFDSTDIQEDAAWLASPWRDLSADRQLPLSRSSQSLDIAVSGNSPAQYVVAIANGGVAARSYAVSAVGDSVNAASVFRLVPVMAADGNVVYDPVVPLPEGSIEVASRGVEYLWLQHTQGDGTITVSVSTPDGWSKELRVHLDRFNLRNGHPARKPKVGVWAYSSDTPVWPPEKKPDVVNELREAGVNVFVIHPNSVPVPGNGESWKVREGQFRDELRLYKGAGELLLYLAWDDRLKPAMQGIRQKEDIGRWLGRLVSVLRDEGYRYQDWALYPIDEPTSADFGFLLEVSELIKAVDPNVRLYANPGKIVERDLRPGGALIALLQVIDLWQPQIGPALDMLETRLRGNREWWVYQVGNAPAKRILPACYRKLAWVASQRGADGFGMWSFSDTGGTTAWNDIDGVRPDWAVVYDSPDGVISSRRWEAFKAGIQDYQQLAVCRAGETKSDEALVAGCSDLRRRLDGESSAVACR